MQTNHCETLSELELEQAAGGGAILRAAMAAEYVVRKHGAEIVAAVAGAVAGWLSE